MIQKLGRISVLYASLLKQQNKAFLIGLAIFAACLVAPAAEPFALIAPTNAWKYNDESIELGTNWIAPGYDDSSWSNGLSTLGFRSLNNTNYLLPPPNFIRTLLRKNTSTNAVRNIMTFYFRTHFNITNAPAGMALTASNLIDDGAVFYLNGVELTRVAMPSGPIFWGTLATRSDDIGTNRFPYGSGHGYDIFSIPVDAVVQGDNVVSVEVHQASPGSPDMAFQMELWASFPTPTLLSITNEPLDIFVEAPMSIALRVGVSGVGGRYQWHRQGVGPIAGAFTDTLYIPSSAASDSGSYYVVITNEVNSVTSRVATVQVQLGNSPTLVSAHALGDSITVKFSEDMQEFSTTNLANYQVVTSAGQLFAASSSQLASGSNAILSFVSLPLDTYYVIVNNVRDASASTNLIASNSTVRVGITAEVVPINTTWRYEQNTNDLGPWGWTSRAYDDSAWTGSGPALLDGKSGGRDPTTLPLPVGTVLIAPTNGPDGVFISTTYFRTHFNSYAAGNAVITFRTVLDDAAVLYLNGVEFSRIRMATGVVHYATLGTGNSIFDAAFEGPFSATVTNLESVGNVIAVEVHQITTGSTDVTWGGEFSVSIPSALVPFVPTNAPPACTSISFGQPALRLLQTNGTDLLLSWTNPVTNSCGSNAVFTLQQAVSFSNPASSSLWSDVTTVSPYTAMGTNASRFFRLKR